MQPFSRSSFIPKKSIKRVERVRGRKRIYILSYAAYGIFFSTILAAVAVFLYSSVLQNQLEAKIAELDTQRASFEQSDLQTIKAWEEKLRLAEAFFDQHLSPYRVLLEIEQTTANDIRYTSFSYASLGNGAPAVITLTGETDRFDSVVFQDDTLQQSQVLGSAQVSSVAKTISAPVETAAQEPVTPTDIDVVATKPVTFAVALEIPAADIMYDKGVYQTFDAESVVSAFDPISTEDVGDTDGVVIDDFSEEIISDVIEDEVGVEEEIATDDVTEASDISETDI